MPKHGETPHPVTNTDHGKPTRHCRLPHLSAPVASDGTDPPSGTFSQRCGGTGHGPEDIRALCLPPVRTPHGHAASGVGSSDFSASLVSLPVIQEPPPDASDGVNADTTGTHHPCPVQTGVCPQFRPTPGYPNPAPQTSVVSDSLRCLQHPTDAPTWLTPTPQ